MAENPISFADLFDATGPGRQELDELAKSVAALALNVKALGTGLDTDAQRIAAGLAAITGQTGALREQAAALTLGSDAERAALAALGTQVAQLAQQQQAAQQAAAGQAAVQKGATDAAKAATSQLKLLQTALREAYAAADAEAIVKAANDIKNYTAQTDQLNKALRGANSTLTAVAGSYNRLSLETQQLGQTIRALPEGFEATDAAATQLKEQFYANTQQLKDFDRELNQNFREVGSYAKGILEAVAALNQEKIALTGQVTALKTQATATQLSAEQQEILQQEIRKTEAELGKVNSELGQYGAAASKGSKESAGFGAGLAANAQQLAAAYFGIQALVQGLGQVFDANVKYSDSVADVAKTTGLGIAQTNALAESLKKVDTRTGLAGLLEIANVGGQLGVAGQDIEAFTKAIDVSVQALSDDFKGGAEEIATELGKLNTVFKAQLGPDLPANLLHIGSALNQLGAVGAATAPQLADVALRVGAVAANTGLGLDKVLAYAAVLQELGFDAEVSGTSLNKLLGGLTAKPGKYFAVAQLADSNLTLKEFTHLINTDVDGALQLFLRGLNTGGTSTTQFAALVQSLGLKSGAVVSVLTALAKNTELVGQRQATANQELQTGNSLAAEAALKNNDLAGSYNKLKNEVSNFFTSGAGADFLKFLIDGARLSLNLKDGLGKALGLVGPDPTKAEAALAATQKQVGALTDAGQAAGTAATQAEKLYATYAALSAVQERSTGQQQQLNRVTLQLRDVLGEKIGALDQETGAYKLNTGAVELAIKSQKELLNTQAAALAQQLQNVEARLQAEKNLEKVKSSEQDTRVDALAATGFPLAQAEDRTAALGRKVTSANLAQTAAPAGQELGLSAAQVEALVRLRDANDDLGHSVGRLKDLEAERATVLAGLQKLGLSAADADALLGQATAAGAKATDDSVAADKKKKQAVADVLKAQLELRKFTLEDQAKGFDRQAANVANPDDVRTRAVEKAAARRKEIARLDEQEADHEAQLKNAKLVNGDQALAAERETIHATFLAKIKELGLSADQQLIALAESTANQLAAADKAQLEAEAADLERTAADENKSYQARETAALNAQARRIEIIQLESDVKRRLAKGDVEVLRLIQKEEDAATATALRTTRAPNADLANNDLGKQNTADQLALAKSLGGQLATRQQYTKAAEALEDKLLAAQLANLEADGTKEQQAADLRLKIQQRANDKELKAEEIKEELKKKIIQQGFATAQSFADAFFTIGNDQRAAALADLQASQEKELTAAGDNAELKAKINADYAARELAAKRKQAQYDKAQALFSIAINTAQAVTSVLSTGGGTRYADFGISAGILTALVIAAGVAQAVAIAAKPLPNYFVGRAGGPAEYAHLAERGPELVGQPGSFRLVARQAVGYLAAGDRVFTAPETQQQLAQNELVAGRLVQRQQGEDMEAQTGRLRAGARAQQVAAQAAFERDNAALLVEMKGLRRDVREQEQLRVAEGELQRWKKSGDTWTHHVNKRYHHG